MQSGAAIGVEANIVAMDFGSYREHYVRAALDDGFNAADAGIWQESREPGARCAELSSKSSSSCDIAGSIAAKAGST